MDQFLDVCLAFQKIVAKPLRTSFYRTSLLVFNFFYHYLKEGDHLVLSGVVRRALL